MNREIKGRFVNGKVELLEESDLEEGEMVNIVVPSRKKEGKGIDIMATSGAWKDDAEYWDEFVREWYVRRGRTTS